MTDNIRQFPVKSREVHDAFWRRYITDIMAGLEADDRIHGSGLAVIWSLLQKLFAAAIAGDHEEAGRLDMAVRDKIELELGWHDEDQTNLQKQRTRTLSESSRTRLDDVPSLEEYLRLKKGEPDQSPGQPPE